MRLRMAGVPQGRACELDVAIRPFHAIRMVIRVHATGFEPVKHEAADVEPVPVGRLGTRASGACDTSRLQKPAGPPLGRYATSTVSCLVVDLSAGGHRSHAAVRPRR